MDTCWISVDKICRASVGSDAQEIRHRIYGFFSDSNALYKALIAPKISFGGDMLYIYALYFHLIF